MRIKPIGKPIPDGLGDIFMVIWCLIGISLPFVVIGAFYVWQWVSK